MPTKAELQAQVEELQAQVEELEGKLTDLASKGSPIQQVTGKRCINCGQRTVGIIYDAVKDQFSCPSCKHVWTLEDEQAPFRSM